jgi:PPOX class probable F420-dependent enzyme
VSLATFRKTGEAVRTPVWVAPDDGCFYVFSAADAGKVKRLKNSSRAELAVCDVRGRVSGPWQDARAVLVTDAAEIDQALHALRRKYGWQMWLADAGARLTGRFDRRAYIRVELTGE